MSNKIAETLSFAGGNLARPTRFSMLLAPPVELIGLGDPKVLDVLCKSVKVPDVTNEPLEMKIKGHTMKIPGRTNQDLTLEITFYLDENHNMRQLFHEWINGLDDRFYAQTSAAAAGVSQSKNYFGNILIKAREFDESKIEPMNYLIEGVYPTSVSGMEYGSGSTNEVQEVTVTFAYFRFLSNDITGSYDNLDNILDGFGISPSAYSALGSFGQVGSLVQSGLGALGNVTGAINSVSSWF